VFSLPPASGNLAYLLTRKMEVMCYSRLNGIATEKIVLFISDHGITRKVNVICPSCKVGLYEDKNWFLDCEMKEQL
jgi:hypothetical protein